MPSFPLIPPNARPNDVNTALQKAISQGVITCAAVLDELEAQGPNGFLYVPGLVYHLRDRPPLTARQRKVAQLLVLVALASWRVDRAPEFPIAQTLDLVARWLVWEEHKTAAGFDLVIAVAGIVAQERFRDTLANASPDEACVDAARALFDLGRGEAAIALATPYASRLSERALRHLRERATANGLAFSPSSPPDADPVALKAPDLEAASREPSAFCAQLCEAIAQGAPTRDVTMGFALLCRARPSFAAPSSIFSSRQTRRDVLCSTGCFTACAETRRLKITSGDRWSFGCARPTNAVSSRSTATLTSPRRMTSSPVCGRGDGAGRAPADAARIF